MASSLLRSLSRAVALTAAAATLALPSAARAQGGGGGAEPALVVPCGPNLTERARISETEANGKQVDIIGPHIRDSHELDLPSIHYPFVCTHDLPRWAPVHIGSLAIDLSPTKHVVWMGIASVLCLLTLLTAAAFHRRHLNDPAPPSNGFAAGIEAMVLYLRQNVVLPNVGPHGDGYTGFILTIFFFILFANLVGLVPFGSTATGNISVTLSLALISFVVIEISGMVSLGRKYWSTIFYWNHDLPIFVRIPMFVLMTPLELVSKFTKPFALTIRLFANMTAGHVVLLALISLIFTFANFFVIPGPIIMAIAISFLELFVAFLQAFIFALLTAVFIGQIRQAAH
jgi:F-type H+-transporting ATPase subunit a